MNIDPVIIVLAALAVLTVAFAAGRPLKQRADARAAERAQQAAKEAAEKEERQRAEWARQEAERKERESRLEAAHERLILAKIQEKQAHDAFRESHEALVESVRKLARYGCDMAFRQRFGVARPPHGETLQEDADAQDYLREHYAELRDAAIAEEIELLVQRETDRRLALERAQAEEDAQPPLNLGAGNEDAASTQATDATQEHEPPVEGIEPTDLSSPGDDAADEVNAGEDGPGGAGAQADGGRDAEGEDGEDVCDAATAETNADDESEPGADDESEPGADDESEPGADEESEPDADDESESEPDADDDEDESEPNGDDTEASLRKRAEIEASVREHLDLDSLRLYLRAAIGARFNGEGSPSGELPWPAYTYLSPRGFGELCLVPGAPENAQDAYCQLAWRKFHLGRRAEKPGGGEYSWPESHELGNADAGTQVETPAGTFSATVGGQPLPLREQKACTWVRHDLAHESALLVPDGQHSLLVSVEGLRKGDRIDLRFDCDEAFLEEAPDSDFTLNAVGETGGAFVGMMVSKPEVASPGDAPYELVSRDGRGFAFRMTADARRHDADMYPQFIQADLVWCAPPSLEPEAIVRHIVR